MLAKLLSPRVVLQTLLGAFVFSCGLTSKSVYAIGSEEKKGLRQCCCIRCNGCWVPISTFFRHQHKQHDSFANVPTIPKYSFSEDLYNSDKYRRPLYDGANTSVLQAIIKHLYIFSANHGMSKSALSDTLRCEKSSLPQPNLLPESFKEAKKFIKPLLMPLEKYDVCVNDCIIYCENVLGNFNYKNCDICPKCSEPRKCNGMSRKTFTYMPLGQRLARWFGTSNLCKLLYANKISTNGVLHDFTDGKIYKSWFEKGGVFENNKQPLCVPLSLFTDGVNPNKHMTAQKSMWPLILTWINLPVTFRQLLGPMMLMGIIPSGENGTEPKSLEPYLGLLTDELLCLTEFPVLNAYIGAPVNIKVALLQYLCDIPAYSKVFHLSGHSAIRSCPYCREKGYYCLHLRKTIHISNRSFLQSDCPLKQTAGFADNNSDNKENVPFTMEEEASLRQEYDNKPNRTQKSSFQKKTGLKGTYTLMRLPYHNRMDQMQPDGMHTLVDFLTHIFDVLTGKHDGENVRKCEKSFNRFHSIWKSDESDDIPVRGKKRKKTDMPAKENRTPWSLSKEQIEAADERATKIVYPHTSDISPGPHFSKPWTLHTMNSKLQFVTCGAMEWCIHGMLPHQQEHTLFNVFDIIKRVTSPTLREEDLQSLQTDAHTALSLLERDFPLSLQNLVTHLIHHIVDGLPKFGPLYGRWLFPYERANGWITRQCLRKGAEESTVMETYAIYDWCVYMILSQKFNPAATNSPVVSASKTIGNELSENVEIVKFDLPSNGKECQLTAEMKTHMEKYYRETCGLGVFYFINTVIENNGTCLRDDNYGRDIKFTSHKHQKGKKNSLLVQVPCLSGSQFGLVSSFLEHNLNFTVQKWAIIDTFSIAEKVCGFFKCDKTIIGQRLVHINSISKPLVFVHDIDHLWILNSN